MITRLQLGAILVIATLLQAGTLYFFAKLPNEFVVEMFASLGGVVSVLMLVLFVFDRWGWKWPLIKSLFVKQPIFSGTWKTRLQWGSEPSKDVYMVVRQRFSHLSIRMLTDESRSKLVAYKILPEEDGQYEVAGIYRNEPKQTHRDHSPIHYGSFRLHIHGDPATGFSGSYWTDRDTAGDLQTLSHLEQECSSWKEAQAEFEAEGLN